MDLDAEILRETNGSNSWLMGLQPRFLDEYQEEGGSPEEFLLDHPLSSYAMAMTDIARRVCHSWLGRVPGRLSRLGNANTPCPRNGGGANRFWRSN